MKERIGNKVKYLRQEKLMTQSELAGDRITRSMLSLIEHGNSEPSLASLSYLAERLHVTPAYLVASKEEEEMYRRAARINDVRIAYGAGEYRICLDLCRAIALPADDELNLLSAECSVALAVEEISAGRLHGVPGYLETAMEYAGKTRYRASHIYAEAAVLSRYLSRFSESFYSEAEDAAFPRGIPASAAGGTPFCAYALCLFELEHGETDMERMRLSTEPTLSVLRKSAPSLASHIDVLLLMREEHFEEAYAVIGDLLGREGEIPLPILYELFRDREICARELGDYKGAYESAGAKHEFFSRLLSET